MSPTFEQPDAYSQREREMEESLSNWELIRYENTDLPLPVNFEGEGNDVKHKRLIIYALKKTAFPSPSLHLTKSIDGHDCNVSPNR